MQNSSALKDNFMPVNEAERLLLDAKAGTVPVEEFLRKLATATLFVSSTREVKEDGNGFMPLLFERDGVPLAAVFTAASRATLHSDKARYGLSMNGLEIFRRMPAGYGVVINPGYSATSEITPDGIKNIIRDFGGR